MQYNVRESQDASVNLLPVIGKRTSSQGKMPRPSASISIKELNEERGVGNKRGL